MKVLLTGSAGFIGFHLAKKLLDNNAIVIGVDNINQAYDLDLKKSRLKINYLSLFQIHWKILLFKF